MVVVVITAPILFVTRTGIRLMCRSMKVSHSKTLPVFGN